MRDPILSLQPWLVALGPSLAEALPRLYGTPPRPVDQ